jgi:hypothetical protein
MASTKIGPWDTKINRLVVGDSSLILEDPGLGEMLFTIDDVEVLSLTVDGMQLFNSGPRIDMIYDNDDLSPNSATGLATQQSIKAYFDAGNDIISEADSSIEVVDTGDGQLNFTVDGTLVADWKLTELLMHGPTGIIFDFEGSGIGWDTGTSEGYIAPLGGGLLIATGVGIAFTSLDLAATMMIMTLGAGIAFYYNNILEAQVESGKFSATNGFSVNESHTVTNLTGVDVNLVTGTGGTANLGRWNADGDLIESASAISDAQLTELVDGSTASILHKHPANYITITDAGNFYDGAEVEVALQEVGEHMTFWNGTFHETFNALVTEDGGTLTLSVEQAGGEGGDLEMVFSSGHSILDCTPAATVEITPGADDANPQEQYVYIPESTKILTVHGSQWPAEEHIKVAYLLVPSVAEVAAEGCFINQNWNDHARGTDNQGHLSHLCETIRLTMGGANWSSGVAANGDDSTYLVTTGDPDEIYFKSTAGVCYQMHRHTVPAFNMQTGTDLHVVNWFEDAYHEVADIAEIIADSEDGSLNNKYYNLVFWGTANKTGEYAPLMCNLPTGSYNLLSAAIVDSDEYDVTSLPDEYTKKSSTGFLICRLTLRKSGTTFTLHNTTDLRGLSAGAAGGAGFGGGGGDTNFPDNAFSIFDQGDVTRVLDFVLDGITTGNTRTITPADADMTLLSTTDYTDLTDAGNTTLHVHDIYVLADGTRDIAMAPSGAWSITDTDGDDIAIFTSNGSVELFYVDQSIFQSQVDGFLFGNTLYGDLTVNSSGNISLTSLYADGTVALKGTAIGGAAPTWNPADMGSNLTLSNGNLTVSKVSNQWRSVRAIEDGAYTSGKWYWEVLIVNGGTHHLTGSCDGNITMSGPISTSADGYAYRSAGEKCNNAACSGYGDTYTTNDVIGIALDMDSGKIWFAKNNVWQAGGNPAAGTGEAFSGITAKQYIATSLYSNLIVHTLRVATGDMDYSPPSGFNAAGSSAALFTMLNAIPGGAVDLYHGLSVKLSTSADGIAVTGTVTANGLTMGDTEYVTFGAGPDGTIYSDGTSLAFGNGAHDEVFATMTNGGAVDLYHNNVNVFETTAAGAQVKQTLKMNTAASQILNSAGETAIEINANGNVELYFDNAKKFETTTNGATLSGVLISDGLTLGDNEYVTLGAGPDALIYSDGDSLIISNGAGTEVMADFVPDGPVSLYYDSSKAFETAANGIHILDTSGGTAAITFYSDGPAKMALQYATATKWVQQLGGSNENAIIANLDGGVELYYDNLKALATQAAGINVYDTSGDDPQIYLRDSSNNVVGQIGITDADMYLRPKSLENGITINDNGSVVLYYNNLKVLETTAYGIDLYDTDGNDPYIQFRDSGGGAEGAIQCTNDDMQFKSGAGEIFAIFNKDTSVDLYYDNAKQAETISGGFKATNSLTIAATTNVTGILDEDDMASNSPISLSTQQSIKAYVDTTFKRKNLIINGAINVAQRGTSFVGVTTGSDYTLDRWQWPQAGAATAVVDITQDTDVPDGFGSSLKIDVTTIEDLANDVRAGLRYGIIGSSLQHLNYGDADAKEMTLSFYFKSDNKTGTMGILLFSNDSTRVYMDEIVIADNNWNRYEMTILPDTNSGFINDNNGSLYIYFMLANGADFDAGTKQTWAAYAGNWTTVDQDNFLDHVDNNIWITGVQLEVGSTATEFEYKPFSEELERCRFFYERWTSDENSDNLETGSGYCRTTTVCDTVVNYVTKRAVPTISVEDVAAWFVAHESSASATTGMTSTNVGLQTARLRATVASGLTVGNGGIIYSKSPAGAWIEFDSEI